MTQVFVIGDEAVVRKLRRAGEVIPFEIHRRVERATSMVAETARAIAPFATGATRLSIGEEVERIPFGWQGSVTLDQSIAVQGPFNERGTGIYGDFRRPFLVHRGETTFLHPGMRAQPFIEPAYQSNKLLIEAMFEEIGHVVVDF